MRAALGKWCLVPEAVTDPSGGLPVFSPPPNPEVHSEKTDAVAADNLCVGH